MNTPQHIGIILDGNRRWAQEKGLPTHSGHYQGLCVNLIRIIDHSLFRGVKILTAYGFSTDNWNRTPDEVAYLMQLFDRFIHNELAGMHQKGVRIRVIGDTSALPLFLQQSLEHSVQLTTGNQRLVLNLALNYGGREEIVRAFSRFIAVNTTDLPIKLEVVSDYLDTSPLPDPDLIIRTGGEKRLSNFLTWQSSYSELYFIDKYWPDFSEADLDDVIADFQYRQRRWGR
jgi:undecaprenyl diphosphate synthase